MIQIRTLLFLIAVMMFDSCGRPAKQDEAVAPQDAYNPDSTGNSCTAQASWFTMVNNERQTPPPNEGPTSVFANNATVSNCDFHQWSWQKFLWLTSGLSDKPLFLDSLRQVTPEGTLVQPGQGVILRDTAQASGSKDILITNKNLSRDGRPHTVYYSIHVSNQMYKTMVAYGKKGAQGDTTLQHVTFPVGALELKVSWVDARALSDTTTYFITRGQIKGKAVRIALLGMHVVGVVQNHPEFIWATFEHDPLAPAYNWGKATPTTDALDTVRMDYPLFSRDSVTHVKNISTATSSYTNVFSVYKYGVPVQKEIEGSFDVLKYMETSQPGSVNFNNIRTINEDVKRQLGGVWNNYFYNGSIWINTGGFNTTLAQAEMLDSLSYNLSASTPGKLTRGSVSVYNITMETYVQVGFGGHVTIHGQVVNNLVNCFSCHNTNSSVLKFNSPLLFSHVFSGYVSTLKGATREQVKQEHVDAIRKQFLARKQVKE